MLNQKFLRIGDGHAALSSGSNGLTIARIRYIAGSEEARKRGARCAGDCLNVALWGEIDHAIDECALWIMSDCNEEAVRCHRAFFSGAGIAQAQAVELAWVVAAVGAYYRGIP